MKSDAVARGGGEQRRRHVVGHLRLIPVIRLGEVLVIMARKERGQSQFRKHHELHPADARTLQQADHPIDGGLTGFGELDRSELGSGDGDDAGHWVA